MTKHITKVETLSFLVLAFFVWLYLATIYPGIGGRINFGDSTKWAFLWAVNGTPHATGYPLFLLLSKIIGHCCPFIDIHYRMTLLSLLPAWGTLFLLYKIAALFLNERWLRLLPTITLGSTYIFWSQATETEVYVLNAFFVALVLYLFLRFHQTKQHKFVIWGSFVYAISFGNHLTMITLLPALIYIVAVSDYKVFFNARIVGLVIFFVVLGFSQYIFT